MSSQPILSSGGKTKIYTMATHCIYSSKLEGPGPGSMAPTSTSEGVKHQVSEEGWSDQFDWAAEATESPAPDTGGRLEGGRQLGGSSSEYCWDFAIWNLEILSTFNSVKIDKLKDWNLASILNNNNASGDSKFSGM